MPNPSAVTTLLPFNFSSKASGASENQQNLCGFVGVLTSATNAFQTLARSRSATVSVSGSSNILFSSIHELIL